MPLRVTVVGGGFGGLALGIGLARKGHSVILLERRPKDSTISAESGAGLQFQPNVSKILSEWEMLSQLREIAHDNEMSDMRDWRLGSVAKFDFKPRGPAWFAPRKHLLEYFTSKARENGVGLRYDVVIQALDVSTGRVILQGGETIDADLIVGADGSYSSVRRALFPDYHPSQMGIAVFCISLDLEAMRNDADMAQLIDQGHNSITASPGRSIFASPALKAGTYDIQFTDHEYSLEQDPNPEKYTERIYNLDRLRKRWSDHDAGIRKVLAQANSAFKWRLVEVSGVPSWSHTDGKVVLLGDAVHAMTPFAGQGSAMAIEDAAMLSEILGTSKSGDDLLPLLKLYETLRRSRCETVQKLARTNGAFWCRTDRDAIEDRIQKWKQVAASLSSSYTGANASLQSSFKSNDFMAWLDQYDVLQIARKALSEQTSTIGANLKFSKL